MENESRHTMTMDEAAQVRYSYNGQESYLTEEMLRSAQRNAEQKVRVEENIDRLKTALSALSVDTEQYKSVLKTIESLESEKKEIRDQQTAHLKRTGTPYTKMSDALNNEILSPLVSFLESYFKKKKEAKAIYTDIMMKRIGQDFYDALSERNFPKLLEAAGKSGAEVTVTNPNEGKEALVMIYQSEGRWNGQVFKSQEEVNRYIEETFRGKGVTPFNTTFYRTNLTLSAEIEAKLAVTQDMKAYMDTLEGAEKIAEQTNEGTLKQENNENKGAKMIEDYNAKTKETLLRYAVTPQMRKAIEATNFKQLAARGVCLWNASEESLRKLANGGMTDLVDGVAKDADGRIRRLKCKVKIYQTESGYAVCAFDCLRKPGIPEKIAGVQLSEAQKEEIKRKGSLRQPVAVEMGGREMLLMPYLDRETNQVFLRDYRKLEIERNYKGQTIDENKKERLIHGEIVEMENLTDKQGQRYSGYVKINPMTGKIEEYVKPSNPYRRQVAANNNGERTADLGHDKDTVLKSGQTRNDDPKTTVRRDTDKENKKTTKTTRRITGR